MSARIGYIMRNEDVHGVSGSGKVAEVFEASNGKCAVFWISPDPSVNVYDHIKSVQNTHGHGGKTKIVWVWESEPDPDPMEEIFEKKIEEAKAAVEEAQAENSTGLPPNKKKKQVEAVVSKIVEMLTQEETTEEEM